MSASRWRDERGLTLPFIVLVIGTLVLMVSFAVDLGRQRSDRRLAQAGADVVALDMMREVEGRTFAELVADQNDIYAALSESADRNGFVNELGYVGTPDDLDPRITGLEWGMVAALGDGDTFDAFTDSVNPSPTGDADRIPNAVRIKAERTTDYFFQPGEGTVTRFAIAAFPSPTVDLTVGSVAAGFQPSVPNSVALNATVQALNARLAAQFGATVPNPATTGFDLVGYRGLAAADVDMRRVAANLGFASPTELADSTITAGQFFNAAATALDQQAAAGDPNAANAAAQLRRFNTQMGADSTGEMRLGDTFELSQGTDDSAAGSNMNVLDLLAGSANVINGENFASYTLTPAIPGVASATVQQYLVRDKTFKDDQPVGQEVENNQMRFQITLTVAPLSGMSSPLTLPIVVEAAKATGRIDRLDCADPLTGSEAEIDVTTSGVTVRLGTTTNLAAGTVVTTPAVLVQGGVGLLSNTVFLNLGLTPLQVLSLNLNGALTATGSASVLGGFSEHVFTPYVDPPVYQRAPGGVGSTSVGAQLSNSLTAVLGSNPLASVVNTSLRNQLAYVFNDLQALILNPVLQQAGVSIAGADLLADDQKCEGAGLKLVG